MAALMPPATGSVTSQAKTMLRNMDQSTFSLERNLPTQTTEPTLQWVVLMGILQFEATSTVRAEPISMQKPLKIKQLSYYNVNPYPTKLIHLNFHLLEVEWKLLIFVYFEKKYLQILMFKQSF